MRQTYTFHLQGMHCNSCVVLTETELSVHEKVQRVRSSLVTRTVDVEGDFGDMTTEDIIRELSGLLSRHILATIPERMPVKWKEFLIALPAALLFMLGFIGLQKLGIVNSIDTSIPSYGTAFIVGIVASLSTCMAVVGGLVFSMSATFAKEGDTIRPQLFFHIGRLVSFFLLGGIIGVVGSVFRLGTITTVVLGVGIGAVMLVLGINLLDIVHWTKNVQPVMPRWISKHILHITHLNHRLTPILIGILSFFLPCGFTQSMQIYTLSTGNFLAGAFTMFSFALGTLPILAIISFSSFNIQQSNYSGVFFKTAGLIVIMFAVFNILNSMVIIGWVPPIFNV